MSTQILLNVVASLILLSVWLQGSATQSAPYTLLWRKRRDWATISNETQKDGRVLTKISASTGTIGGSKLPAEGDPPDTEAFVEDVDFDIDVQPSGQVIGTNEEGDELPTAERDKRSERRAHVGSSRHRSHRQSPRRRKRHRVRHRSDRRYRTVIRYPSRNFKTKRAQVKADKRAVWRKKSSKSTRYEEAAQDVDDLDRLRVIQRSRGSAYKNRHRRYPKSRKNLAAANSEKKKRGDPTKNPSDVKKKKGKSEVTKKTDANADGQKPTKSGKEDQRPKRNIVKETLGKVVGKLKTLLKRPGKEKAANKDKHGKTQRKEDQEYLKTVKGRYDDYLVKKDINDYFAQSNNAVDDEVFDRSERSANRSAYVGGRHNVTVHGGKKLGVIKSVATGIEVDIDELGRGSATADGTPGDALPPWLRDQLPDADQMTLEDLNREIAKEHVLATFSDNPQKSVKWEEPKMLSNCWIHAMLARGYSFSPSCNQDGTYLSKQCYLERCWCVTSDGAPVDRNKSTRFYYKKNGIRLRCVDTSPRRRQPPPQLRLPTTRPPPMRRGSALGPAINNDGPVVLSKGAAAAANIPIHFQIVE